MHLHSMLEYLLNDVLAWPGFVKKEDPTKPRNYGLQTTQHAFVCRHCERVNPNVPLYKVRAVFVGVAISRVPPSHVGPCLTLPSHHSGRCTPPPPNSPATWPTASTSLPAWLAYSARSGATKKGEGWLWWD